MFNKNDLKNGMVVEFNDGTRRMVWDDKLIDYTGHIWLDDIRERDLKHLNSIKDEYIVKIYDHKDVYSLNCLFKMEYLIEIWSIY